MRSNQIYIDGRLYRFDYSGAGPPWPMQVWDDPTQAWQNIGIYGAQGPAGPAGAVGPAGPAGPSYAPLMTGDAAPTMVGTGDGQPVLVPIL